MMTWMDHRTARDDMAGAKSSYPAISLSVMFLPVKRLAKPVTGKG